MSGPDRIWAWKYSGQHTEGQWRSSLGACPTKAYECIEYRRADLCDPTQDERVKALVEAAKRVREDFEDMREVFDGLASGTSVTTWAEMDPCGPMDAWMEGERLLLAALRDMGKA